MKRGFATAPEINITPLIDILLVLLMIFMGSLPYGAIVNVMDTAKGAGVERLGVITEGMRKSAR